MNHVTLYVADVERSVRFYQSLLGMSVLNTRETGYDLSMSNSFAPGDPFLGIYAAGERDVEINHVCFGIDSFNQSAITEALESNEIEYQVAEPDGTANQIYFNDPDGLLIQLQDVSYCGGSGPVGGVCASR